MSGGIKMSNYRAGDIIRLTRQSLGMSQEELSFNICSVQTLSRIENGHHKIKRDTYQKLMERMGRNGAKNYSRITVDDFNLLDVMQRLDTAISKHEHKQADEYIRILKKHMDLDNTINRQFIRRREILVDYNTGKISGSEKLKLLEEIAALTIPDYRKFIDKIYPFMDEELQIIMNIAGAYFDMREFEMSIKLYKMLLRCLDIGYMDINNTTRLKVILMNNMAKAYNGLDQYDTAIELEKEVIEICKKNKLCSVLQNAYGELAWSILCQIKEQGRNKRDYELCKKYLRQGYAIALISENYYTGNQIKNLYEKEFHEKIYAMSSLSMGDTS